MPTHQAKIREELVLSINHQSLNEAVRQQMLSELRADIENGTLYLSDRLTSAGQQVWPKLLEEACSTHDDAWLASQLRQRGLLNHTEQRRKPKGGFTTADVPSNAAEMLSEGEFNRLYARGLCADVIANGGSEVEVYRGKAVSSPRSASEALIGRRFPAEDLLADLRTSQGVEPALGLPPGPNSGLTVRRI